ncbi:MAG: hypothetical protein Q8928_11170 [Bacteroidota bacterium]|nr:hypothetical protein [Bacteroidota bacterium]
MKAASLKEIKTELNGLHPKQIQELCILMAKFKKENKELLSYLLFEAHDEKTYIKDVKSQMDELFKEINKGNSYLAKKTIRKILGVTNKHIKYSGSKQTEIELLIHFCKNLRKSGIPLPINSALGNIYLRLFQKITKAVATLHEDLQFDYSEELRLL